MKFATFAKLILSDFSVSDSFLSEGTAKSHSDLTENNLSVVISPGMVPWSTKLCKHRSTENYYILI